MRSRWVVLLSAATLLACGDDDPAGLQSVELSGVWAYTATNLSGSGVSCFISGSTATVNQAGSTFTGTVSGGSISCSGPGGSSDAALGSGVIVNGMINGNSVSFDVDTSDFHHVGTISGNSMSGTATLRLDLGAPVGQVTLSGNWSAAKQ